MKANSLARRLRESGRAGVLGLVCLSVLPGIAPAAPEKSSGGPGILASDPRLGARLTVTTPGITLGELIPRFAEVAGVRLTLAPELGDEKVVLFGPARPAGETLEDLAALLDLRWERTDQRGIPGYRLSRPPEAVRRARLLEAEVARRAQARVDAHAAALAETPEQLKQRPERDYTRILLEDPEWRPATQFYALLNDRQKAELFTRKQLLFPLASLSPMLQAPLREVYLRRVQQEEEFFNSPEGQEALRKAGPSGRAIRHRPEDLERNAFRLQALRADGYLSVGMNLGSGPTVSSVTMSEEGKPVLAVNGWPVTLVDTQELWVLPAQGSPYGPSPEDPANREQFGTAVEKLKPSKEWIEQLRALAETATKPVLADYYRGAPVNRPPVVNPTDAGATPGEQRLDRFCANAQYLWWTRGSSLLLRKRDWITQSQYEVPESWLRRMTERLASRAGAVRTPDVALAAELTAAQADGLTALAQGGYVHDSSDREAIQALLSLAATSLRQRDRPLPITLSLADLPPMQQQGVAQLGPRIGWDLTPEKVRAFRLQLTVGMRRAGGAGEFLPVHVQCDYGPTHSVRAALFLPLKLTPLPRNPALIEKAP